jgi:hypothetical protein
MWAATGVVRMIKAIMAIIFPLTAASLKYSAVAPRMKVTPGGGLFLRRWRE